MVTLRKKVYKALEKGPMTNEELFKLMPEEKRTSVRAIITLYPEMFVRLGFGVIGRRNRDEHLAILCKNPTKIPTTAQLIKCYLATGSKTLQKIFEKFPDFKEEKVRTLLAEDREVTLIGEEVYFLKQ